jgi:hypothetical protein
MADPISAAIAAFAVSAGASAATAAIIGTVTASVIVAAGSQLAINALTPKAKVSATASQLQTKIGAVSPRAIVMGRTAVAGTLLTPTPLKSGKDDRFASNFYALSHAGPSGVVESIQWGDDVVTFDGNGNAIGKYNDNMWLFQKNGSWSQTAISYSGHAVLGSSTPSAWDSTKTGKGCLMVALVVRYAAKVLGGNMQTPLFVVDANAVALTDPRTGSAATTQAQRRNPAVWAYSWRLGWFQNSRRVIGMGQASPEIHTAAYAYAANVADTNSWTIGGEATTADDRYAVETIILQTCASIPVERNGLQSVVTSAVRSSVGTITSDDLRADPKWRYNTQQSSRPTAIQTRYRSESNRWQMIEGAEVTDAGWLTQDAGREKRATVEYPYAAGGSAHVGHLAALEASNAREPLIFTLQCKQQARYDGFVGDAVTVSLPEIGLSSTKMVITSRVVNPDGTVDFDLLVETDAKYAFAAGKTSVAPSFTLQPGFDIFSVPQPGSSEWASVAAQITSGATSLPIVRVTGSASDYSFASGVVFKIRLNSGGSPWLVSEDAPPAATQHEFRGLTNATSYIVGVAYRGVTGVEGPVRELAAVTTGVMVSASTGAVAPGAVRVGTDIFPGSGSTPLPGTQLLNDQIGIDANGRLTNAGTGTAVVGNAQITIDANGRLTTTGTGTTVVDNSRITLTDGALATVNTRTNTLEAKTTPQNTNNYIGNSNFSGRGAAAGHSLDSWTIFGSTGSVYSNIFQTQSYAEITGATAVRGIYQDIPVPNEFITGTDYWSMSALVRNIGSGAVRFYLQWLNEARDTSLGYSNTMQSSGSGWEYRKLDGITESIIRPAAARWIRVHFDNNGATIASGNIQSLTNFTLTRTQYAMPWTASGEVPSIYAAVKTEESARASGDSALATRATTLEARSYVKGNLVKGSRPNYDSSNPNNLFSRFGWGNQGLWNVSYSAYVDGPYLSQSLTSQTNHNWYAMWTNAVPVAAGVPVSAQALLGKFGTWSAGTLGIVIYWFSDLAGTTLVSGATNGITQNWEDGLTVQGQVAGASVRWCRTENQIAPTGAQSCRLGIYTAGATGNGTYTEGAAWMLKAEYGSTCTAWSDDALPLEIDARVRTEESARASGDSANAASITTLTARISANPNLFPYPTPVNNRTPTQLGWIGTTIDSGFYGSYGGQFYYKSRSSGSAVTEYYIYDLPDNYALGSVDNWTVSGVGVGGAGNGTTDYTGLYLEAWDPTFTTRHAVTPIVILNDRYTRVGTSTNYNSTFQTVRLRVVVFRVFPASGSYQEVWFNMIKVEAGTTMTAFTNTAQITNLDQVSVEARGRAYAISGTQTEVNGRKGGFVMDNNGVVTNFQITADDFRIYQSIGGSNIVPFRVVGGQTQINDALVRTLNVIPDGGGPSHRVQLRPNSVSGADGASFTFSPVYGGIPLIRPVVLQPPALAAGETYDISATSLSASGFTIRAKKFTAGTPTAQSSGAGSNVGGTPAWQAAKPTSADADGNSYTFSWTATLPRVSNEFMGSNTYYAEYEGEFDVYYNAGSGWVYSYSAYLAFASFYTGSSPSTVTGQAGSTTAVLPAIGQHGGNEFGLHAISGTITAFAGVSYTTTSQSSVTALPGNFTFDIFAPT